MASNNNVNIQTSSANGATVNTAKSSASQLKSPMDGWQLEKKEVREKIMIYSILPAFITLPLVFIDNPFARIIISMFFIVLYSICVNYFWGQLEKLVKRLDAKVAEAAATKTVVVHVVKDPVVEADNDDNDDDVKSVYAFDALNDVQSAPKTEGGSPFGFHVPKYGYSDYRKTKEWCFQPVNENVVNFYNKSPGPITLTYDGNDLKSVKHGSNVYTSFEAMPSKVADILVAARVVLVNLGF
uniref:Pecanex-like protein n=1 Tax=Panagrellus redivivus TaxID=6233 RepID=A0A7E4ZRQ8_PANRE